MPIGGADMPTVISLLELLRRPVGEPDGLRARQLPADHRRGARRLVGPDPVDHHVQGDEPLVHQRAVRPDGREHRRLGRRRLRRQGEDRPRPKTWPWCSTARSAWSSCPATAWPSPRRSTRSASWSTMLESRGTDGRVRHPPRRRPHAGAHERAAGRGRRAVRPAQGDGRDQPDVRPERRGDRHRRQRRGEPAGQHRPQRARSPACRSSTSATPARWSS